MAGSGALWRERNFQLFEDEWPRLRRALIQRGSLHGHDRDLACMFMALQFARTREHISKSMFVSELAEFSEDRPPSRDVVRKFIQERYHHTPDDAEVQAAWDLAAYLMLHESVPSFDQAFSISMGIATTTMAPLFDGLLWRVEITGAPVLWTSDRPVMPWRPPSPRDEFEGLGYANSDEIRMPLSPTAMLILRRHVSQSPARVSSRRFHEYNTDIALQCYEFVVCTPTRRARLDRTPMARSRPAVRFNTGPEFTLRLTGRSPAWATFFTCGLRFAHLTRPGVPTPSAGSRRARPEQLPVSAADPSGSASQRHRALGRCFSHAGPSRQRYGARRLTLSRRHPTQEQRPRRAPSRNRRAGTVSIQQT